jgi:photosystem II stability/assembly factor-like uncharacterized protein
MGNMVGMMRRVMSAAMVLALAGCCGAAVGQALGQTSGPWVLEKSGTTAGLRGIHAVGGGIAWASGTNGTVLRTEDGGYEWQSCAMPPGAEKLDFRGIWAWDDNTAIVMASGPGDASRLYKTVDGCSSWKLLFTNPDKDGFWDAVNCARKHICTVIGDPVNGAFVVLRSWDGGITWDREVGGSLAADPKKQGVFAASNSSLAIDQMDRWRFFGTGGLSGSSLFFSCEPCRSSSWRVWPVPVFAKNSTSGIFSIGTRPSRSGEPFIIAVGGDYTKPNESFGTAAWSADGGKTWTAAVKPPHGYRSAVAWDADAAAWIAVGTNGSDVSFDDGKTWAPLDDGNWNALSLPWVVGPDGRIAKVDPGKVRKP